MRWVATAEGRNKNNSGDNNNYTSFHGGGTNVSLLVHKACYFHIFILRHGWGQVGLFSVIQVAAWWWTDGWRAEPDGGDDGDARVDECGRWMSGCLLWLNYSVATAICVSSASLLSLYLSENIQIGCLPTCVFVRVCNSSIIHHWGCHYCTLSSTKGAITDGVTIWSFF